MSAIIATCAIALGVPAGSQFHDAINRNLPTYMRVFAVVGSLTCTAVAATLLYVGNELYPGFLS